MIATQNESSYGRCDRERGSTQLENNKKLNGLGRNVHKFGDIVQMREASRKRRTETLDYLQSMLGQLRTMAGAERYDVLVYLIEMAYVEASDIARGDRPARVGMGPPDRQPASGDD